MQNLTLWDILTFKPKRKPKHPAPPSSSPRMPNAQCLVPPPSTPKPSTPPPPPANSMLARYEHITKLMLATHNIRVRKWRTSMTGVAWQVHYKDGSVSRLIEAPRPKGPMSAAVFLHEVGHHAIGFNTYRPRCLEEYHAWRWSLEQMAEHNLNITDAVRRRMHESLWYAIEKARRRGLKKLPPELVSFQQRPIRRARRQVVV